MNCLSLTTKIKLVSCYQRLDTDKVKCTWVLGTGNNQVILCPSVKVRSFASMKHRSNALKSIWWQFGCQNKSAFLSALDLGCFSGHFFPASPMLTALFLQTDSRPNILVENRESDDRRSWNCSCDIVKVQTTDFYVLLCISPWYVSLFLSHSTLSPAHLIHIFLIGFSLYQYFWITPCFWIATLRLEVKPKRLASHMKTCSTVFLIRTK